MSTQPRTAGPKSDGPDRSPPTSSDPSVNPRRAVASYRVHHDAERAVDWLSDEGFPVQRVAIVGRDLRTVEQVTGRVTVARAAGQGAMQGAVIGFFFALLFGIFFVGPGFFGLLVYSMLLAAVFGALLGGLGHALQGGTRDFGTITAMQADHYDVMVDDAAADDATAILHRLPATA